MSGRPAVNERIAARRATVVAARRRRAARRAAVLAVVVAVVVGAVALERSPLVALASVDVVGTERLSEQAVLDAADVELGTSVLRISTGAIQEQVESLPLVERASVERDGPLGLVVTVVEVAPALTASYDDGDVLVDAAGRVLGAGAAPGTPRVVLPGSALAPGEGVDDDPELAVAHEVVLGLPGPIAALVEETTATAPDDVTLRLVDGTSVRWGDATRPDEKARAFGAVLEDLNANGREVATIDVRAPAAPTAVP